MHKPNVLFIPRWYPHRYDPMGGLFIERLARALKESCTIVVLYLHSDPDCPNMFETDFAEEHGVEVIRVYYQPGADMLTRWFRFYVAFLNGLKILGSYRPDIIHGHILTRHGILALLAARRFGVPFIISEHWSRYFPESNGFKGILRRIATRFVVHRAAALIPVSHRLQEALVASGLIHEVTRVIPNTVDVSRFRILERQGDAEIKTVVHISCFDDRSKNISGFLDVIKAASLQRSDFRCLFIGEGPDLERMKSYAESLELPPDMVVFTGLLENEQLTGVLAAADFSVLSSRYETFGTVVIESMACGVPVLATRTGIVPEIVTPDCGVVVEPGNRDGLAHGFLEMLDRCRTFDKQTLRDKVEGRFSDDTVAAATMNLYHEVLNNDKHD